MPFQIDEIIVTAKIVLQDDIFIVIMTRQMREGFYISVRIKRIGIYMCCATANPIPSPTLSPTGKISSGSETNEGHRIQRWIYRGL